jgi:membrane-anchored protein YejM (alkaline phosphatase superfamily)
VDDFFARMLQELEAEGLLENTVIIGVTDHYTYGYKDMDSLLQLSGVEETILLEKTPCFVWSADCTPLTVEKTLNTSDFLPTMLNILGVDSPYHYLGQDAFDDRYAGYALFADGSWICDGWMYCADDGSLKSLTADESSQPSKEWVEQMRENAYAYINASNLLLTANYYQKLP